MAYLRSRTPVSSDVPRLQCYLHLDRVSRLELVLVPFAELSIFVVANFPNPDLPGVPRLSSVRNWVLGAVAYIACWILWKLGRLLLLSSLVLP